MAGAKNNHSEKPWPGLTVFTFSCTMIPRGNRSLFLYMLSNLLNKDEITLKIQCHEIFDFGLFS